MAINSMDLKDKVAIVTGASAGIGAATVKAFIGMMTVSDNLEVHKNSLATMDLKDKVAIVTGASAGIGAATVKALLNIGMKVVGFARRKERIENLVEDHNGKLFALSVDVTKPEDILDGFSWVTENVGPVHVLVNNAGVASFSSVITGELEAWQKVMNTNFMSIALTCREAVRIMKEHNTDGYIININSVAGYYDIGDPGLVMYRALKCALVTMTENIRIELARMQSKIKITTLSPGVVKTEIMEALGYGKEESDRFFESVPHLNSEDIANTIVYLLSTPPHVHIAELIIRPTGEYVQKPNEIVDAGVKSFGEDLQKVVLE